jgi:hypothetical protein
MARRKPVPSLVPPPVTVTTAEGERDRDANGNISTSTLPFPLPPTLPPAFALRQDPAFLSPSDAVVVKRRSRTYSEDTLAVMEEQRRKRAMLHGRYGYADVPTSDDADAEPDGDPGAVEKDGGEVARGVSTRSRVPFPAKLDSYGQYHQQPYYPNTMQRQLLQASGVSARRRREEVSASMGTNGTKTTNGFKGCTSSPVIFFRPPIILSTGFLVCMVDMSADTRSDGRGKGMGPFT